MLPVRSKNSTSWRMGRWIEDKAVHFLSFEMLFP